MEKIIALVGNPNVGKSTLFNNLTGLHQHTGNWAGKTVDTAMGRCKGKYDYIIYDLPGTYSLDKGSAEEMLSGEFIRSGRAEAVVVVCDAVALERNMHLLLQVSEECDRLLVAVNMMDEAKKKGISLELKLLSERLDIPVTGLCARSKDCGKTLIQAMDSLFDGQSREKSAPRSTEQRLELGKALCREVYSGAEKSDCTDRKIDRVITGRIWAFPIMLLLLLLLFYLSIKAANMPSEWLMRNLFSLEPKLMGLMERMKVPGSLAAMLCQGAYRTLAWVVAVMLPPMAVFFPLFTLLEDSGYLPRLAYNLDKPFRCCGSCGKQALTMCMGFGCNAAAVVGCRIIDSEKERYAAMLTNAFVPCNGRFPALIAIISMFAVSGESPLLSALLLTGFILLGIFLSFLATKLLTATVLKGRNSVFALEMPPYRMPCIGQVLVRSVLDRTLAVLSRAVCVAAPAGAAIWILANTGTGGESLLQIMSSALEPLGCIVGMDGVILAAFILGLPANEIVLPIAIMIYAAQSGLSPMNSIQETALFLRSEGWSNMTALCVMVFFLCHPCSTTLLSIKKESGSIKMMFLAWLLPTAFGLIICALISGIL